MFGYPSPGFNPYPNPYPQAVPDQLQQLRAPYQAQQYPPQQMQQAQVPQQPQSAGGILWCQGEEGAKAWPVAPGGTVQLMDSEADRFYIKSVDQSGMPRPLRVFDFKERLEATKMASVAPAGPEVSYVTREEFERLSAAVAALTPQKEADNG